MTPPAADQPPPLDTCYWLAFTPDTPAEIAAARFAERIGAPPGWLLESKGVLWAGPLPEGDLWKS